VAAHTSGATHRERLVAAMAALVAERGYPAVTVADVVARARVSKRTFYEQFAEREDCLLATYVALAEEPLQRIAAAAADPEVQELALTDQVGRAVSAYLAAMAERPALTQALLTEIASTGERGRAVRRAVLHRFADQLVALAEEGRARHPGVAPLPRMLALGLVGGINELVLDAVEGSGGSTGWAGWAGSGNPGAGPPPEHLAELTGTVTDLVVAVLLRPV